MASPVIPSTSDCPKIQAHHENVSEKCLIDKEEKKNLFIIEIWESLVEGHNKGGREKDGELHPFRLRALFFVLEVSIHELCC